MNSPHVHGACPRRADQTTQLPGPKPRMSAEARERARELTQLFAAQMQQSMLDSLAGLTADEPEGGDEASGDGSGGVGDLSQLAGMSGIGSASTLGAAGGASGLGALAGSAGSPVSAGAGGEASLAQRLLAALEALESGAAGGAARAGAAASAPVTGINAPAGGTDAKRNAAVVADVARKHGVDPVVAVAMMLVESGGNAGAVGDGGTSFGLFQLHKGGMLTAAGLTPQQAFDPRTNASVSLRSLAHEWKKGPNRDPGAIAAASQRPADPAGYAVKVNAAMDRARSLLNA